MTTSIRERCGHIVAANLSVEATVQEKLRLITAKNPALNALAYVDEKGALSRARALDKKVSQERFRGRLLGSTFSTRLSIDVEGMPQSNGSVSDEPTISKTNAAIIERAVRHGAVCIGKGNIAERGRSYFTENPRYGKTNHPFNSSLTPGGSGGGDAAAVASGLVDFAIGADAGGSVRVPANFCGLYGISATPGSLSETGHPTHAIMRLLKSMGMMARSLDDLEILYTLLEGFDDRDPYSHETYIAPAPRSHRFLICQSLNGVQPDTAIMSTIDDAAKRFERLGYTASRDCPQFFNEMTEPFVILVAQAQLLLDDMLATRSNRPPQLDVEGIHLKFLRHRVASELPPLTAEKLLDCWHRIDQGRQQAAQVFQQYDFILLPVSATLPIPPKSPLYSIAGKEHQTESVFQFSTLINALGLPAVAVPSKPTPDGIPVGFQVAAPRFREHFLFNVLRQAHF